MLNPFIFGPNWKWEKDRRSINEERNAQDHGRPVRQPAGRNRLTLRLGILLIRMGKELTGETRPQAGCSEAWLRDNQSTTRPARLHHA